MGRYLPYGCVAIIATFNPEHIVLDDIVSTAGKPLLRAVHDVTDERVVPDLNDSTSIAPSSQPADAIVSGAAAADIIQFLLNPPSSPSGLDTGSNQALRWANMMFREPVMGFFDIRRTPCNQRNQGHLSVSP